MAEQTIDCPKCGKKIPITSALTAQVEEQVREELKKETAQQLKAKDKELEEKLEEIKDDFKSKAKVEAEEWKEKFKLTQETYEKKAKREADEKYKTKLKDLEEQVGEQEVKIEEQRQAELDLRKRERDLVAKAKEQELVLAKKLDLERSKIQNEVQQKYQEETRLKEAEKDHLIQSLKKTNDELVRKLEQGSQQSQGEAIEEDIENTLVRTFYMDTIEPIDKGVKGADIHQIIHNETGKTCGSILWECKRTKNWNDSWITKVKEDRQRVKADLAVIVTEALPKEIKEFGELEGVWITNYKHYLGLANVLRVGLVQVAITRLQQAGKDQNIEVLHKYLTGSEFHNRVEAILEPYLTMKDELEKEKRAIQSSWAKREKHLEKAIENTAGMYGDLQGIMGKSLPEIKTLELPPSDS